MTFLFQYYRILGMLLPRHLYTFIVVGVGAWSMAMILQCFFLCQPLAGFWDKTLPGVKCLPELSTWLGGAIGNILTDLLVFALPIPMLSKLNLPGAQKVMLLGVFSLGFLCIALSVVRIKYLRLNQDDVSWSNSAGMVVALDEERTDWHRKKQWSWKWTRIQRTYDIVAHHMN
ncbi:integral membrane protein [Diaporthe amygdali]|uniref:uncharacterized protein n=1 Tax=Phomopsis amygdali TaxID=1214568 RepID=UPI0022FDB1F4|nr:uncharacterized protein J7T55_002404 [Diaporthe amygdali]KAJ0121895.1 integral membrane protein [Diaporthe amygdali]